MENLLALVDRIQQISPLPIFSKEVFIVQNAGMQHWLNMSLAQTRGISFNVDYALPAQYLWKLLRSLTGKEGELDQTPFSREALCWRIYQLLATEIIINDSDFSDVTRYWSATGNNENEAVKTQYHNNNQQNESSQYNLKRYQLSCQLADLFEQYLVFRPDWIDAWHENKININEQENADFAITEKWQAKLWQMLIKEQSYNPLKFVEQAQQNLENLIHLLPKRLCFFGINAMAPMWLSFVHHLSKYTEVHFFHLNPCFTYWGDIVSEKQAIKLIAKWTDNHQEISESVGNPLLANLGQQGREFLSLLQQYSTFNIEAFSSVYDEKNEQTEVFQPSVLSQLQDDILTLKDARQSPQTLVDDSIVVTSSHSALREVQGLHDWLLHQFNNHDELTPKDVLVMCPQVEHYAPYVNAVFARGWQDLDNKIPPLPCSIADRISKDADPLVAAFSELLTLPDSRFQVSQILSWLRLPAMQNKFDLQLEDIEKFTVWIENACIHWGLDQKHKQQLLETTNLSEQFTWHYGLSRLLQGFAYSDHSEVYENKLVLPDIEGNDAILLGKLMLIIEQLQYFTQALNRKRSPVQWHSFLSELLSELFEHNQETNFTTIYQAIEALVEYCQHANFEQALELNIVREFLDSHFSQPDPGRQFMVGQVTFCSMLPMRSIPFKIVAVLGLNDGEYPRQRVPLGFDLMAMSAFRLGDRSRRGDDRYLFLEAIISARQTLYLSYQGRNIKNNNEKQPSIVLKELMEYLSLAYGWQLFSDDNSDIRQLAMQPYSEKNYLGQYAGFDAKWLALQEKRSGIGHEEQSLKQNNGQHLVIDCAFTEHSLLEQSTAQLIDVNDVIRFYQHPSRHFGQKQLALYLDNNSQMLADDEPFDCDHLTSYLYKQQVLEQLLMIDNEQEDYQQFKKDVFATTTQQAQLSGRFPHLPQSEGLIKKLTDDSEKLADFIVENNADNAQIYDLQVTLEFSHQASRVNDGSLTDPSDTLCNLSIHLDTRIQVVNNQLVAYRSSLPKGKDFFALYINLLILQVWQQQNPVVGFEEQSETAFASIDLDKQQKSQALAKVNSSHGYYFDTKGQKPVHYYYACNEDNNATDAKDNLIALLKVYLLGQQQALLLNGDLAEHIFKAKSFTQSHFDKFWSDDNNGFAFGNDPYIQYFWRQCPALEDVLSSIQELYLPIITTREQVK